MGQFDYERAAREVLSQYGCIRAKSGLTNLGNGGGFSGARIWRGESALGDICLRAWPPGGINSDRLADVHRLMKVAKAAGLSYVPALLNADDGASYVDYAGRLWEVSSWMPGRADFRERPSDKRLEAAVIALAHVHEVWSPSSRQVACCPAIARRIDCLREWRSLIASGWRPRFGSETDDPVTWWAKRAWLLLNKQVQSLANLLSPWTRGSFICQPCLCDIWHDHVLFQDQVVTGIIDFGGLKEDHVATDLARLLGSLVGDDQEARRKGFDAYSRIRKLSEEEESLAQVLDVSGTILGLANWLIWLFRDGRQFHDHRAVAERISELVRRAERWPVPRTV